MVGHQNIYVGILSASLVAGALVAIGAPQAEAQTAGNLNCAGCVKSREIRNKSIRRKDLGNNAITSQKVRNSSLTGSDLAPDSVPADDLSNEAGGDFDVNPTTAQQAFTLGSADVYRSFELTAPSAGQVILNASGVFSGTGVGNCSISKDALVDPKTTTIGVVNSASISSVPFAITWGESVTAGSQTWNLVCEATVFTPSIINPALTGVFVPTRY